jgi:hypothetical protein
VLIWLRQVQALAARLYQAIVLLSLLMSRLLPLPQAAILIPTLQWMLQDA